MLPLALSLGDRALRLEPAPFERGILGQRTSARLFERQGDRCRWAWVHVIGDLNEDGKAMLSSVENCNPFEPATSRLL